MISCPALADDLQWLREHDEQHENKDSLQCIEQLEENTRVVGQVEGDDLGYEAQRLDRKQETRGAGTAKRGCLFIYLSK